MYTPIGIEVSDDYWSSAGRCLGKEAYVSRHLAERIARRRNKIRHQVSVYRCDHCHKYHLGTTLKWRET